LKNAFKKIRSVCLKDNGVHRKIDIVYQLNINDVKENSGMEPQPNPKGEVPLLMSIIYRQFPFFNRNTR